MKIRIIFLIKVYQNSYNKVFIRIHGNLKYCTTQQITVILFIIFIYSKKKKLIKCKNHDLLMNNSLRYKTERLIKCTT